MNYIQELRKSIGHQPIIICCCGCLIFNEKNQVLLQRRSDNKLWGNPGGIMELGETIYDTVKREIKEELGINLEDDDLTIFNIYSGEGQHHIYPNGDEVYFVNIIFKTSNYRGTIEKDNESLELKFFDLDKLPSNITKPFEDVKDDLIKQYKDI